MAIAPAKPRIMVAGAKQCVRFIEGIEQDSLRDRIFGLILGAFVGDSCGSCVEAERYMPNEMQLAQCLRLGGGGHSSIGSGQAGFATEM